MLIEQVSRGDERALAEAYDRFGTLVYSIAYHFLGDAAEAEEVAADVFMQVWTSAATFDPARASVGGWLSMITRSRSLDRVRAGKRRNRVVQEIAQSAGPGAEVVLPDQTAETADLRRHVARSLAELPTEQRKAVELAFFRGLSHSEIAELLDEPLGTIKTRIRMGMTKLRGALAAYSAI